MSRTGTQKFRMLEILFRVMKGNAAIIEAETYGTGVNMFLPSQRSRVKVLYLDAFVKEMKGEIERMREV